MLVSNGGAGPCFDQCLEHFTISVVDCHEEGIVIFVVPVGIQVNLLCELTLKAGEHDLKRALVICHDKYGGRIFTANSKHGICRCASRKWKFDRSVNLFFEREPVSQ